MKIIFAAGGTGGHINPALAVAGYIREKHPESGILFVGTADKMESRLVPAAGFDFKTINISGFQRKISFENIRRNIGMLSKLLKSSSQAKKIIRDFKPDAVVGFGGYVSGPVLRAASRLGVKTAIHEQNAYPGITNKALAGRADAVMLTVADAGRWLKTKKPCVVTGLPVRSEILNADRNTARAGLGISGDIPVVLSTGGSLGADSINKAMLELIIKRCGDGRAAHIHAMGQYGLWMIKSFEERGVDLKKYKNIIIKEYIDDMDKCLAAADLVIGRAGASSLSEIEALGKPSILIPSPNVSENHQYHNAMALASRGAAIVIEEKNLTPELLIKTVDELVDDPARRDELGKNAKKMAVAGACEKIAEIILGLCRGGY